MKRNYRTHYDNLKLSQHATAGQIRTAYRRLSKKYHPDHNADPDAVRVMQLINRAYDVLSDANKRREHDQWISEQDKAEKLRHIPVVYGAIPEAVVVHAPHRRVLRTVYAVVAALLLVLFTAGVTAWLLEGRQNTVPLYTIYPTAPNGSDWPLRAGYVQGYPQLYEQGQASLHFINPHTTSAVFAQLYGSPTEAVGALRTVFLPAQSDFTVKNLPVGGYRVRYMRLDSGQWQQSAEVALERKTINLSLP